MIIIRTPLKEVVRLNRQGLTAVRYRDEIFMNNNVCPPRIWIGLLALSISDRTSLRCSMETSGFTSVSSNHSRIYELLYRTNGSSYVKMKLSYSQHSK